MDIYTIFYEVMEKLREIGIEFSKDIYFYYENNGQISTSGWVPFSVNGYGNRYGNEQDILFGLHFYETAYWARKGKVATEEILADLEFRELIFKKIQEGIEIKKKRGYNYYDYGFKNRRK